MHSNGPTQIETHLFLGNMEHANARATLRRLGITHVLSMCQIRPNSFPGVVYRHMAVNDHPSERICSRFKECFRFIDGALQSGGKVLVHCYAGVSRSATVVIAYTMNRTRMSYPEAFGYIRRKRPVVDPNVGFVRQLHEYSAFLQYSNRK